MAESRETLIIRLTGIIGDLGNGVPMTDVATALEVALKIADEVADIEAAAAGSQQE